MFPPWVMSRALFLWVRAEEKSFTQLSVRKKLQSASRRKKQQQENRSNTY
jgi:hypothetical protein